MNYNNSPQNQIGIRNHIKMCYLQFKEYGSEDEPKLTSVLLFNNKMKLLEYYHKQRKN